MRLILPALVLISVATAQPTFDAASVKPSPPPEPNRFGFPVRSEIAFGSEGRFSARQATLLDLILRAYGMNDFQVTGGPKWLNSDRFDVVAQGSGDGPAMLQSLLAERFQLRVQIETRESPVFSLLQDGKLGPQLRRSGLDCAAIRRARGPGVEGEPSCRPEYKVDTKSGTMTIRLLGETMEEFARILTSPETRRAVRNETGLSGTFDLELAFTPEPLPGFPRLPGSENGLSLFTALKEQLGLRLESGRGPMNVLVVIGAEHPSGN